MIFQKTLEVNGEKFNILFYSTNCQTIVSTADIDASDENYVEWVYNHPPIDSDIEKLLDSYTKRLEKGKDFNEYALRLFEARGYKLVSK